VKHKDLVRLIRRIAREEAFEVIDEHLDDYEHKEKSNGLYITEGEKSLVVNRKEKSPRL